MIQRFFLILFIYFAALTPAFAQWSSAAVQALPYLYHDDELRNDLAQIDKVLRKFYILQLQDYYLNEVNRIPAIAQNYAAPLTFDELTAEYVSLYQTLLNDFTRTVQDDKDHMASRMEEEERQAFKTELTSEEMVTLKEFYLSRPQFFDFPLSFSNFVRFAASVETQPKHDLAVRQPLAGRLAGLLRLQEADYAIQGDSLHAISPDIVEKNLRIMLANEFTAEQLENMVSLAESETGQKYLSMKDRAFKNRFLTLEEIYQRQLANTVDNLITKMATLPPPLVVYQKTNPFHLKP
ncbi:MAG: hypothetical protein HY053_00030 [Proteobacteria bacterium]|nr:hypothetical protein [Pseudomonadota bacterium]